MNLEEITTRHNTVEAFATDPDLRERLRDQHLRGEARRRVGSVAAEPVLATAGPTQSLHDQALLSWHKLTSHGAAEGSSCTAQRFSAAACLAQHQPATSLLQACLSTFSRCLPAACCAQPACCSTALLWAPPTQSAMGNCMFDMLAIMLQVCRTRRPAGTEAPVACRPGLPCCFCAADILSVDGLTLKLPPAAGAVSIVAQRRQAAATLLQACQTWSA